MECVTVSNIFCLYLKSMAKVSVCERGRENERERDGVWVYLHSQILQSATTVCDVKGPGLRLK